MEYEERGYALGAFDKWVDSQLLSTIIPCRFILQYDASCTTLRINFNPTPEQLDKLRAFQTHLKLLNCK